MVSRRKFLRTLTLAGLSLAVLRSADVQAAATNPGVSRFAALPPQPHRPWRTRSRTPSAARADALLDPNSIPKFRHALVIPPAMPRKAEITLPGGAHADYYEIAVRQFQQQVLPQGLPKTTVYGYGAAGRPESFNYPGFTVEARVDRPVRVKWINDLKDAAGNFLPHPLPVDQTIHWANPPGMGGEHNMEQEPYMGPVPAVTHVHGAHVGDESDGFTEAWYLPAAANLPAGYQRHGVWYEFFGRQFARRWDVAWEPGSAVFQYPNDQRPTALWYHDHTLGITRLNVYAGAAGFYLLRGGADDLPAGALPGPAPQRDDAAGTQYHEIPILIQDRMFNADGSLFYPADRAYFEGRTPDQLQIPFYPDPACGGASDIAPLWNPEFFGNALVVNGRTWPYLEVEARRYRFRFLNGCNARFLILRVTEEGEAVPLWVIGSEGGFLPEPAQVTDLLMAPGERYDVIVDFGGLTAGTRLLLRNVGPDEPYGGGQPGVDFTSADPNTTGQVVEFRVVAAAGADTTTPPDKLKLPTRAALGAATLTRRVSMNELESATVRVHTDGDVIALDCADGEPFGPMEGLLGTVDSQGRPQIREWHEDVTENPALGATEVWEVWNFTEDAHPVHLHQVMFEVVNREPFGAAPGAAGPTPPEPWERGVTDTVIAYPGQITRLKAHFDLPGLYVWHCHILEHEDNEMMRPLVVGPMPMRHRTILPGMRR